LTVRRRRTEFREQGRTGGESTGQRASEDESYLDYDDQLLLEEMAAWPAIYKPPEWEEFLLLLVK
jgi:hypothetical protein